METIAQLEQWRDRYRVPVSAALETLLDDARSLADTAFDDVRGLGLDDAALFASRVEELSRTVEYLQLVAAGRLDRIRNNDDGAGSAGRGWVTGWTSKDTHDGGASGRAAAPPGGSGSAREAGPARREPRRAAFAGEFRSTTEYLRVLLRISAGEARRRLALTETLLPRTGLTGEQIEPVHPALATTVASGTVSTRAATIITLTLDKIPRSVPTETVTRVETALTAAAVDHDPDFLSRLARRWLDGLDPDGTEPSEEDLRRFQGAFIRKPKNGLNHLEIFATQEQYESLLTVMNAATNPRLTPEGGTENDTARPNPELDRRSRPQKLLDGLIGACQTALACGSIPHNGGLRPQLMATIDYQQLFEKVTGTGNNSTGTFTFTGPVPAATLRKLACDADITPVVLGSEGQILDIGRTSRIFPPHIRKAIATRDQGCAFPGCTMPAPWCEAHHITYWSHGGPTSTDNGTLLCSYHHHTIHKEHWKITIKTGIPWFTPPPHIDPQQKPRRNHYFRC
ncbi:HNH endonuclease signature motif containing protein [Arthrobacter sp. SW1]|uniref:HNH endonuclease signature motif containing protein n=1 Tax=Arthrobacter sp. SW1 TaxID=1920889 RepID=UPI0009F223EF|nr:HNH endonuclease signature motif containing protein [Arthrobacter sp. SW1]